MMILANRYKQHLLPMSGMVIAMFLAMNTGLTAGILLGSHFKGDLFFSTMLAMVIGALAGFLIGLNLGILSLLEGLMAGIMGGMMGAMLGEMVSVNEATILLNIFFTLTCSSIFLFGILSKKHTKENLIPNKRWLLKPLFLVLFSSCYLLFGSSLHTTTSSSKTNNNSTAIPLNTDIKRQLHIEATSLQYFPSIFEIQKNKPITIVFRNNDTIEHDIQIHNISYSSSEENSHQNHTSTENSTLHLHADAKSSSKMILTPLKSGTYEYYCTIADHKENGMRGTLIVK